MCLDPFELLITSITVRHNDDINDIVYSNFNDDKSNKKCDRSKLPFLLVLEFILYVQK